MPNDLMTIEIDTTALLAALDRLGPAAERYVLEASRETGRRVQAEARARLQRQMGPTSTGRTAAAITVQDAPAPLGGVWVYVHDQAGRPANLDEWNEFGTRKMSAQPFLFSSANLEQGAHLRRVSEAITEAIADQGLGE